MYELHYLVPTAGGGHSEKILRCHTGREFQEAIEKCKKYGYTVLLNPMCRNCKKRGQECEGTVSHVWTGCVSKIEVV